MLICCNAVSLLSSVNSSLHMHQYVTVYGLSPVAAGVACLQCKKLVRVSSWCQLSQLYCVCCPWVYPSWFFACCVLVHSYIHVPCCCVWLQNNASFQIRPQEVNVQLRAGEYRQNLQYMHTYTPLPWQPRENISRKQASRDITGFKKHIYAQGRLNPVISQPKYGRCER